jgi:hypothetical protein
MFLTLAQAGEYCGGRSARWARRHLLPNVPYHHPPNSGVLFQQADVDAWIAQYRREPVDLDRVVRDVMGKWHKKRRSE